MTSSTQIYLFFAAKKAARTINSPVGVSRIFRNSCSLFSSIPESCIDRIN
nr:MAG TPA: hypothetical protein [Caudoviricetes sp.]